MKNSSACGPYLRLIKLSNECVCLTQRRVPRVITACRTYASPSVSVVSRWLGYPTVCAYMAISKAHYRQSPLYAYFDTPLDGAA